MFRTPRTHIMTFPPDEYDGIPRLEVTMVSGETVRVMGETEARWFNSTRDDYMRQLHFTETTDLRDLDRLLVLELMVFRWTQQLAAGQDYLGLDIDADQLRKNIREYSDQTTKVKESMGLNKKARDDAANSGDYATWLADLKMRAKAFGIHREHQLSKALVLMNELFAIVNAYDRSDGEERIKLGFEAEHDICEWIRNIMQPEYLAIDKHFRENDQTYWIRSI